MRKLWEWLTSYPMNRIEQCCFIDRVSGREVGKYCDGHGRLFLAEGRWSAFRVEVKP